MTQSRIRPVFTLALPVLLALATRPAPCAAQAGAPITIKGLGTISFPTSTTSAAAESTFVRGVLLLHVFEYNEAADAFRAAQQLDSSMVMAYWGEAMTYNHAVWDEQDSTAARAVLAKLGSSPAERERRAGTERERGYLHALDVLYGPGPKARRDTLHATAMADLSRAYPADDEARAFYALALLGLSQGVRNVPTYLRAAGIAESVFVRNPRNPGAAHYWIHGMDDPEHAAAALPAARALSEIAPDAGHAQHMTSHIFMALGMWDDVVRANENAMRVVNAAREKAGRAPIFCGHYNLWLEYGYLQQGRAAAARKLVEGCAQGLSPAGASALDPDNSRLGSAVQMWARYLLDTEDWSGELAGWTPEFGKADPPHATWAFVRGFAAARRGDPAAARDALAQFRAARTRLTARIEAAPDPAGLEYLKRLAVLDLELQAELQLADTPARPDSAVTLLRRATAVQDSMPYAFGPPMVDKPAHELLGEVFLGLGRYADALPEFQTALKLTPNRVAAVRGLEQSRKGLDQ